jgi:kynurenine formamidase
MFLQGSTQYDALGHVWYDRQLWNGYDARTTVGTLDKASVLPIAEKGVVGRGVLIDMARHRGKQWLDKGETIDHTDLEAAAAAQNVTIEPHDILCIRTGFMKYWYDLNDKEKFYDGFIEPGLTYSRELVEWFQQREIPNLVTDTIANEVTSDPASGVALPLHCALMRNLGVALTEIVWLDDLAAACAEDGRWSFLYAAAPLKVVGGSGAPVNPIAIR